MNAEIVTERLMLWVLLVVSLSVHEWAHAWSAWQLGDDTAARMGRMTFNPLAHIDLVGTVLLPLLGVPFGWAKPVPVNPARFRAGISPRGGMLLTAIAGPISNVCLAALGTFILIIVLKTGNAGANLTKAVFSATELFIVLNVVLAVFNVFPIPPLDGSKVADYLMPAPLRPAWEWFMDLGMLPLMALILLPRLLHLPGPWEPFVEAAMQGIGAIIRWAL